MAAEPATERELDAYRGQADRLLAELDEEFYLHYAGHKDTLELEPIYERHRELTTLERARAIGLAVDGDARTRELWRFACEGFFGNLTKRYDEQTAAREAAQ